MPCDVPTFDTGFDHAATLASGTVTGVRPGGPAEQAGLRDGMQLAGWSVNLGAAHLPVEVTIREDGETRKLTYLPHGARVRGWRFERR